MQTRKRSSLVYMKSARKGRKVVVCEYVNAPHTHHAPLQVAEGYK